MNRRIRTISRSLVVIYLVLFAWFAKTSVFKADSIKNAPSNARTLIEERSKNRGRITLAPPLEGPPPRVLAESVRLEGSASGEYTRRYPTGRLFAHVTGFFSKTGGSAGAELQFNDVLSGRDRPSLPGTGGPQDVQLTLNYDMQVAAASALGDRAGSVVALDPRDGSVLALYSNPTYDPNVFSGYRVPAGSEPTALEVEQDPAKPLLARAYQETEPPGSTFKVVTAAAGLQSGLVSEKEPVYPRTDSYLPPNGRRPIRNAGGEICGGTLLQVFATSCNSSFAQMGVEQATSAGLVDSAKAVGFIEDGVEPDSAERDAPVDLPRPAESRVPNASDGNDVTARTAIGQDNTRATPLQMAMIAAAVAQEDGEIWQPHVLKCTSDSSGRCADRFDSRPTEFGFTDANGWTDEQRDLLRTAMEAAVSDPKGTAFRVFKGNLALEDAIIGAKTGTAQKTGTVPKTDAWMIAFAGRKGEQPEVAVAVVVPNLPKSGLESTGARAAGPIARQVLAAALKSQR